MGISCYRANRKRGKSISISIPSFKEIGVCSSIAGNRLVLLDLEGKIPHQILLQFLVEEVEPKLDDWLERKEGSWK
jgi:hypothetical protein